MIFTLFGIKVYISYFFISMLTILSAVDETEIFVPMVLSIILHESAHLLILFLFGCKIGKIKLTIGEIGIEYLTPPDKTATLFSLVAGPIMNFTVSLIFLYFGIDLLFGINLILGFINLLPIKGLDGGSVIEKIFEGHISNKMTSLLLNVTSVFTVIVFLILNFSLLDNNYSVYIFCIYLILPIILKNLLKEKRI